MRILVAPDKFKGSLGAKEVAQNIAAGLRAVLPRAEIALLPIADGGEGTAAAICSAAGGEWVNCEVHDPLGQVVSARYCTSEQGAAAVIEVSEASGLWRVPVEMRDPDRASSYGTGELLLHATQRGARRIIVGLGGSATNDGGFGVARALGFRFLDEAGRTLRGPVSKLLTLARIAPPPDRWHVITMAAADVRNPLLGERGATRTFARQKGASAEQLEILERSLARLAEVVAQDFGGNFRDTSGAGAAGGLGFGLASFCGAEIRSGFEVVAKATGLEGAVQHADVVITGEGRLDAQTLEGKAPAGVAHFARQHGKKVYAIVGSIDEHDAARQLFHDVFVLAQPAISDAEAIKSVAELLQDQASRLAQLLV